MKTFRLPFSLSNLFMLVSKARHKQFYFEFIANDLNEYNKFYSHEARHKTTLTQWTLILILTRFRFVDFLILFQILIFHFICVLGTTQSARTKFETLIFWRVNRKWQNRSSTLSCIRSLNYFRSPYSASEPFNLLRFYVPLICMQWVFWFSDSNYFDVSFL